MSLVWDLSSLGSLWDSQEHLPATSQKFSSSYVSQSSCSIVFDHFGVLCCDKFGRTDGQEHLALVTLFSPVPGLCCIS